jgi:hypothetical protein
MIQLAGDCLVLQTDAGENMPFNAQMVSVEILGKTQSKMDPEFVKHAAAAVLHYFRDELGKESVTVAEFSEALEKIIRGFTISAKKPDATAYPKVANSDLSRLAEEISGAGELLFYPRLRDELKNQLSSKPEMLCFMGIRECVKKLAGCHRWSSRCQEMQDQIVDFLRTCMTQDGQGSSCALVVR